MASISDKYAENDGKLKYIVVSSVMTFVVTVAASIIVWFVTVRTPIFGVRVPDIALDEAAEFKGQDKTIIIQSIRISNNTYAPIKDTSILVTQEASSNIEEWQYISSGSTNTPIITRNNDSAVKIDLPVILPDERFILSFLVKKKITTDDVNASNNDSIIKISSGNINDKPSIFVSIAMAAALTASTLAVMLIVLRMRRSKRNRRKGMRYMQHVENNAFLLLHAGEAEDAFHLLTRQAENDGLTVFGYADLAIYWSGKGDKERVEKYLRCAQRIANDKWEIACVNFAECIIRADDGNCEAAISSIRVAIDMSKQCEGDIEHYMAFSILYNSAREKCPSLPKK